MNKKHTTAFNKLFLLFCLMGIVFVTGAAALMLSTVSLGILAGAIALTFLAVPMILMPLCYRFDEEGVSFVYLLLPNERYLWTNIDSVTVHMESGHFGGMVFDSYFQLHGKVEGKDLFYKEGRIRKSSRTKLLLEQYWHGTIFGFYSSELKTLAQRRADAEQRASKEHITDEIVPMEREKRAEARRLLNPLVAEAEKLNLNLSFSFYFITPDLTEHTERPPKDYHYTVVVSLARPDEADAHRILTVDAELLHVRLHRRGYRGVAMDSALKNLETVLTDTLKKVQKNGFESFFK